MLHGMWDLNFPTRTQTHAPFIGKQVPNHWTTRETPDLLALAQCWERFPVTATDPATPPSSIPFTLVIGLSYWESGGRKETSILIGPQHVPDSEFNTFMDRRLFNPSNLPHEGRKWNYGWGNRGSAKSSHCLVRGKTRSFFRPSKWSLMASEISRNFLKSKNRNPWKITIWFLWLFGFFCIFLGVSHLYLVPRRWNLSLYGLLKLKRKERAAHTEKQCVSSVSLLFGSNSLYK